jgi:hypothetical protein
LGINVARHRIMNHEKKLSINFLKKGDQGGTRRRCFYSSKKRKQKQPSAPFIEFFHRSHRCPGQRDMERSDLRLRCKVSDYGSAVCARRWKAGMN